MCAASGATASSATPISNIGNSMRTYLAIWPRNTLSAPFAVARVPDTIAHTRHSNASGTATVTIDRIKVDHIGIHRSRPEPIAGREPPHILLPFGNEPV